MSPTRDTYCSSCGTAYKPPLRYPRTCPTCKTSVWRNPLPVSVVLQPVAHGGRTGLLVVRCASGPHRGKLALVGGFLEAHETWAEGGAREVYEEASVAVDASKLEPFWFASTEPRPNRVVLFSVAAPIDAGSCGPYEPNAETSERGLVFGPGGLEEAFAFALDFEAARRFFAARGLGGEHDYLPI
jgi:ADP-ribose pyrophosphatase YjhB (NUDIX family)